MASTDFGFGVPGLSPALFMKEDQIVRMGYPPLRVEIMTSISGVTFGECYAERVTADMGGVEADLISLRHLKLNKAASGRHKDLDDLENLP